MSERNLDETRNRLTAAGFDTAALEPILPLIAATLRTAPVAQVAAQQEVLLTYPEATAFLGIPIGTLYNWVSQQKIPFVRIGPRSVRFRKNELVAWLEARANLPAKRRAPSSRKPASPPRTIVYLSAAPEDGGHE